MSCNGGNRAILAGQATPEFWALVWKVTLFQSLIRQLRVIGRFLASQGPRGRRRPAPGLADRRWLDRAGGAWSRRHPRQQAGRVTAAPARGTFHPLQLWWRADRYPRPRTYLPVRPIRPEDAWCEDPPDRRLQSADPPDPRAGRRPADARGPSLRFHRRNRSQRRPARSPAAAAPCSCIWRGPISGRPRAAFR